MKKPLSPLCRCCNYESLVQFLAHARNDTLCHASTPSLKQGIFLAQLKVQEQAASARNSTGQWSKFSWICTSCKWVVVQRSVAEVEQQIHQEEDFAVGCGMALVVSKAKHAVAKKAAGDLPAVPEPGIAPDANAAGCLFPKAWSSRR
jgi:hypothetical protein